MLIKTAVPVPSVVFVGKAIVGFGFVLQTTPLAITAAPPSLEIAPPLEAAVVVIDEALVVVIVGTLTLVLILVSESLLVEQEKIIKIRIIRINEFFII